jgi:chromosome partitioning protein
MTALSRETILKSVLNSAQDYDYVIIDCLPSLGILLINALTASDELLIPVQTQTFALAGLEQLMLIVESVKKRLNPQLHLLGILPTMTEHTIMTLNVSQKLNERYDELVFDTSISKSVTAAYSAQDHKSLVLEDERLGKQYVALAGEVLARLAKNEI